MLLAIILLCLSAVAGLAGLDLAAAIRYNRGIPAPGPFGFRRAGHK